MAGTHGIGVLVCLVPAFVRGTAGRVRVRVRLRFALSPELHVRRGLGGLQRAGADRHAAGTAGPDALSVSMDRVRGRRSGCDDAVVSSCFMGF